jgi:ubiquinone/menaquinone biosynthesis C-methylase UbiE
MAMEGWIARWYARLTGKSLPQFQKEAKKIAEELPQGSSVLEVAPGPGYLSVELAKFGLRVTGLDISHSFVKMARENAAAAGVTVDFQQGNASAMPFADASFDFVICRAAFKNFSEPVKAINEMVRVLKPGGRALIHDLDRLASPEANSCRRASDEPGLVQRHADKMDLQTCPPQTSLFAGRFSEDGG